MPIDMREQQFGLEVEFTGITRSRAAQAIADYFGVPSRHSGGGYDKYVVEERTSGRLRTWSLMSDASVRPQKKTLGRITDAGNEYKVEFVTPICVYSDIPVVQELIRRMRKAGGFVNSSCGIHYEKLAEMKRKTKDCFNKAQSSVFHFA